MCYKVGLLSALLLAVLLFPPSLSAQGCCTAGASSLSGFESGVQTYRTLSLSLNYQYNSLTHVYEGTDRIEDPLNRTAEVAYFTVQGEYGLQPRLSVLLSLYFSDKSREITVQSGQGIGQFSETAKFRASGIGDLTLLTKYQIARSSITSPFGLALGGGATLPTGSYTKDQDGSQLSNDLQPGTGAIVLIGWGYSEYGFPELGLTAFIGGMYRYAGVNLDGYRIGDEVVTNIGAEKSIGEYLSASLVLRSRYALQDYANNRFLTATGGTFHDLMPALSYADGPSSARIFGQVPVYRNVRGIQLTSSYLLGAEYRYVFDFRSLVDVIMPEL